MPLVAFRDVSTVVFASSSITINTPANAQPGDVLLAFIGDEETGLTSAAPAGWTLQSHTAGNGGRVQLFTAVVGQGGVTASQPTTFTPEGTASGVIAAYSNVDPNNPLDAAPKVITNPSGTSTIASLTTVAWASYIVLCFASFTNGCSWSNFACNTNPTAGSFTERVNTANGTSSSIAFADAQRSPFTAGGTGLGSATMSVAGTNGAVLVSLRPLEVVGSTTDGITTGDAERTVFTGNTQTLDGVTLGFVASATDIPGTGPPPTAGTITSGGLKFRSDGSLVISTTKQPGAFRTSRGWTINPDGSLYITSAVAASGAGRTADGFTFNPDGALVTVSSSTAIYKTSHGYSINRVTGATYINSTRNPGAYQDSLGTTLNLDGSVFAY